MPEGHRMSEPLSNCCSAPVFVASSRHGSTNWYVCEKCRQPCDTHDAPPAPEATS